MRAPRTETYHVADVGALDDQGARQRSVLLQRPAIPAVQLGVLVQLLLQVAELGHIVKVQAHVRREDGVDEEFPHVDRLKGGGPVSAQELREGGAMEGFEHGPIVVELRQGRLEVDQKGIVDARVADVVADGGDEERESLKGPQQRGDG